MAGETLPLSVFIITQNEADRLGPVLQAVSTLTDDIVVVDSGSTDGTRELAETAGARVFLNEPWPGYGPQKRFAEDQCRNRWLLNVDADEWLPPELVSEIRALFSNGMPDHDGYSLPITEVFPGEPAPHPWAYTLAPVRLYDREAGRYVSSPVHDRVAFREGARIGHLRHQVHHRSVRSLGHQISKLNAYSDQQVKDLEARRVPLPTWRVFTELPMAFLKAYIGRRHFVRGVYGFMTAMNHAISRYLRIAKHVERQRVRALEDADQARGGKRLP